MKKKDFFDDGEARGVDGRACRQQTHLLEEARVKTVPHVPSRVMVFSGEDFTGR